MSEPIGIVGLGRMGMAAAKAYIKAGYTVYGSARRQEVINEFIELGGHHVGSSREVAAKSAIVIVYVLNDQQVIEVITGEHGILKGCHEKSGVICMATIDKSNLEYVADCCAQQSVGFIDCPVTGGPSRIESGTLTLIVAGEENFLERCRPILEIQGDITFVGNKPGQGQAVKHCNQLLVGITQAVTMEVIALAKKSDLDPELVCKVAGSGIAGSDYFRILADSVLGDKPSIGSLGQMIKDVGLVIEDAKRVKLPLLVAQAANQYYLSAASLEMENADTSELYKVLERMIVK